MSNTIYVWKFVDGDVRALSSNLSLYKFGVATGGEKGAKKRARTVSRDLGGYFEELHFKVTPHCHDIESYLLHKYKKVPRTKARSAGSSELRALSNAEFEEVKKIIYSPIRELKKYFTKQNRNISKLSQINAEIYDIEGTLDIFPDFNTKVLERRLEKLYERKGELSEFERPSPKFFGPKVKNSRNKKYVKKTAKKEKSKLELFVGFLAVMIIVGLIL